MYGVTITQHKSFQFINVKLSLCLKFVKPFKLLKIGIMYIISESINVM